MTKLATAVAVVQLVEQGVLSLDDDVRERLPELNDIQILSGPNQLKSVESKLTLRYPPPVYKIFIEICFQLLMSLMTDGISAKPLVMSHLGLRI